jgi:hypothetical protein
MFNELNYSANTYGADTLDQIMYSKANIFNFFFFGQLPLLCKFLQYS